MRLPRHLFLSLLCCCATLTPCRAAEAPWTADQAAARATAAKERKDLLFLFTSSEAGAYCAALAGEILGDDAFKNVVPNDFVLVELDFPRDEAYAAQRLKEEDGKLLRAFAVKGFPTIILADPDGRPYARTGYQEGGAAKFVADLALLRKIREERDQVLGDAAKATGMDRARLLVQALAKIDSAWLPGFYKAETDAILAEDKEDTLGFGQRVRLAGQDAELAAKLAEIRPEFMQAMADRDFPAAHALIDKLIADGGYQGEMLQRARRFKLGIHSAAAEHEQALVLAKELIALAPGTPTAREISDLLPRIEAAIEDAKAARQSGSPEESR